LALIVVGNAANLSFLSTAIPGPEGYLANRPMLAVTAILVQIILTLVLVDILARGKRPISHRFAAAPLARASHPSRTV
jgi:hypothetical protein